MVLSVVSAERGERGGCYAFAKRLAQCETNARVNETRRADQTKRGVKKPGSASGKQLIKYVLSIIRSISFEVCTSVLPPAGVEKKLSPLELRPHFRGQTTWN